MQVAPDNFTYSVQPHAAPNKKPKFRDDSQGGATPQNLMYDSRVVRGNTYSAVPMSSSMQQEPTTRKMTQKDKATRRTLGTKRSATPPPVEGRSHMVMQTEDFLEELTDRPIEQDAETQTQPFMDRPASPLFVRAKIGFDVETQIEHGDLFDFNTEVEPILEVLVGKTIHVAMLEIMQEEELEAIRLQQEEFETVRNVEMAELQRLEAEIKRKQLEKERRIAQEKKRLEDKRKLEETIAARQFSNQFLGELHVNVFDMLEEQGHFYDPVKKEIEDSFVPNILNNVVRNADAYEAASQLAFELLERARIQARAFEAECIRLREEERARKEAEEKERLRQEEEARLAAEAAAKAAELAELEVQPAEE